MLKLDRSKPFGLISPPWHGDEGGPLLDRPAHYDQAGHLFDAHGREIVPGQPLVEESRRVVPASEVLPPLAPPPTNGETAATEASMTPAQVLAQADSLSFAILRKEAKRILGPTCPGNKIGIKAALEAAIAAYQEKQTKRYSGAKGMTWAGLAGQTPAEEEAPDEPAQPAPPAAQPPANGALDLAAWGRGQREYLFAEVRKAIRAKYNRTIFGEHERREAVYFLVDQGLIRASDARKDI